MVEPPTPAVCQRKQFCGRSRAQGGCARSPGPNRKTPVAGLFASFSKWDHSSSLCWKAAPASRRTTSRPRAASSFATTGPPPPAPTTITSRTRVCSLSSPPVALELLAAVCNARVVRQHPADRPAPDAPALRVVHACLRIGAKGDEVRQIPDEETNRACALRLKAFDGLENARLLGE